MCTTVVFYRHRGLFGRVHNNVDLVLESVDERNNPFTSGTESKELRIQFEHVQTAVQYYDKNAPHVYISLLVSFVLVSVATGLVAISIISMALWFHGSVFFCEKAKSSRKSEHFPLPKNKGGFFWVLCVRMERKS
eukprot:TRINITY_DN863_c0_g1_i1.p1 TRINITY_DN863_c0_g1~~TRINITY_DN863_c0_g1_i1.p1  ORF type:complete len:135 (-),score=5.70 TRINITY_DN863_c0_g1_i1:745-1149(-)